MCSFSRGVGFESEALGLTYECDAEQNKKRQGNTHFSSHGSCSFPSELSSHKHILDELGEKKNPPQRLAH